MAHRFSNTRTTIPEVANASRIYGARHFRYPIDVVNHENGLEDAGLIERPTDRMTCRHCKRFQPAKHIGDHHEEKSMMLFSEDDNG
jgi:hypothetical protein